MPEDKWDGLAVVGAFTLCLNGVSLLSDIACHMQKPECDYQFEAIAITSSTSEVTVVLHQNVGIRST